MPSSSKSSLKNQFKGYLPESSFVMAKKVVRATHGAPATTIDIPTAPKSQNPVALEFSSLNEVALALKDCTRCKLCTHRTHVVLGEGNPHPELVFVGEGPGESEDLQARPFVGRSGQLLDKMIEAMGVKRQDVFIANVVKCRPPKNRTPEPDEVATCMPFLKAQLSLLKPKVVVALGSTAAKSLLSVETSVSKLRGKIHALDDAKLIVTFHPSYLLRTPEAKKDCWEDLKIAMRELGWQGKKNN